MWYKNIAGRFFGLVTKHACDGRTDRITTPKTALAYLRRAVKSECAEKISAMPQCKCRKEVGPRPDPCGTREESNRGDV